MTRLQTAQGVPAQAGGGAVAGSATAAPAGAPGETGAKLLSAVLQQRAAPAAGGGFLQSFLASQTVGEALLHWLGGATTGWTRDAVLERLNHDVAAIDDILNRQLNAVLHNPRFQRLESAWRGLAHVVAAADEEADARIAVRVLNVTWQEAGRDFERAPEFDQSRLFHKIYEEEFGTPGGKPYGLLIGDYEIGIGQSLGTPINDLDVLRSLTQVAAAAFCPLVVAASPALLELGSFSELERSVDLERTFGQPKYIPWRSRRGDADSRFAGLVLPRILLRGPYQDDGSRTDGFRFVEDVSGPDHGKYLWGNASFAFAVTAIRAFGETGWLSDVCGVRRGEEGGGLVTRFSVDSFRTDRRGIAPKSLTDVVVTDSQAKELADLGFIPLCQCHDSEYAAFYSCRSMQKPAKYDRPEANINAQLSAMLNYILCASQFARYLKVMIRDRVGSSIEPAELETYLNNWLHQYVTSDDEASPEVKARYPLREAQVSVRADPSRPGSYLATIHLRPHFQFDQLNALVQFDKVEMAPVRGA
ncbi:MAG: type VI secretion system contractile sheath large subunit [Planctomycetia bacterium]|nr:type VI secretion system contractile sheath large subunit [Planctomycetia bacterium]